MSQTIFLDWRPLKAGSIFRAPYKYMMDKALSLPFPAPVPYQRFNSYRPGDGHTEIWRILVHVCVHLMSKVHHQDKMKQGFAMEKRQKTQTVFGQLSLENWGRYSLHSPTDSFWSCGISYMSHVTSHVMLWHHPSVFPIQWTEYRSLRAQWCHAKHSALLDHTGGRIEKTQCCCLQDQPFSIHNVQRQPNIL